MSADDREGNPGSLPSFFASVHAVGEAASHVITFDELRAAVAKLEAAAAIDRPPTAAEICDSVAAVEAAQDEALARFKSAQVSPHHVDARECTLVVDGVEIAGFALSEQPKLSAAPFAEAVYAGLTTGSFQLTAVAVVPDFLAYIARPPRTSNLDPAHASARRVARETYPAITAVCRRPDRFRATLSGSRRYLKACLIWLRRRHEKNHA